MTTLDPHYRGDTFDYDFTLGNDWVGADFTGGVKFTLRDSLAESSTTTDDDAVYQATVESGEITFSGADGTILIPASATTSWPIGTLQFDIQGTVNGVVPTVYTIDSGTIKIVGDVTRAP